MNIALTTYFCFLFEHQTKKNVGFLTFFYLKKSKTRTFAQIYY